MTQTPEQIKNLDDLAIEYLGLKKRDDIQNIPENASGPYQVKNDVNIDEGYIFQTLYFQDKPIANNDPANLPAHRFIIKKAHGRILISGLGLGNSLHELLKNDKITYIQIVEKNQDIIDLVAPSFPDSRLEIIQDDIFQFEPNGHFDCIYHALWNTEKEAKAAVQIRKTLKARFDKHCDWQGFAYISPQGGAGRGAGRKPGATGSYKKQKRTIQKGIRYLPKEFEIIQEAAEKTGKTPSEIAQIGAVSEAVRILLGINRNDSLDAFIQKTIGEE